MVPSADVSPVPALTLSLLISQSEELRIPTATRFYRSLPNSTIAGPCFLSPVSNEPPRCITVMIRVMLSDYYVTLLLNGFSMRRVYICKYTVCCGIFTCFLIFFLDVLYTFLHLLTHDMKGTDALFAGGA